MYVCGGACKASWTRASGDIFWSTIQFLPYTANSSTRRSTCLSAYVSRRQHTSADVSRRQHTSADVSRRQQTSADVSRRQHTSASTCRMRSESLLSAISMADTTSVDKFQEILEKAIGTTLAPSCAPPVLHVCMQEFRLVSKELRLVRRSLD